MPDDDGFFPRRFIVRPARLIDGADLGADKGPGRQDHGAGHGQYGRHGEGNRPVAYTIRVSRHRMLIPKPCI